MKMKIRRLISLCMILVIILGTTSCSLFRDKKQENFVPVLRFAIASDVHVEDSNSEEEEARLAKLFELSYRHAEQSGLGYNSLDAVIFAGDFTNLGTLVSMQKFKSIVDANIKPETQAVVALGNHEFFTESETTEDRYKSVFGKEVDEHLVIEGFHFIKLSPNGESFSEEKLQWLRKELDEAALAAPNQPIFVIQHQHVKGTVYGSTGWGVDGLYEILDDYPQVVDFSGHSHFPIQDERSLWQGDFTAIGTGTLSYVEMGLNGVSSDYVFPIGKEGDYRLWSRTGESDYSVFQILECDKHGNMRLTGYDLISEKKIFERDIEGSNKVDFINNEIKKETTPVPEFRENSECRYTIEENGDVLLTVPQAVSDAYIESYRAEVYNNGELVGKYYALSGQIFIPASPEIIIRINLPDGEKEYIVKVFAVNAYEKDCTEPLELKIVR